MASAGTTVGGYEYDLNVVRRRDGYVRLRKRNAVFFVPLADLREIVKALETVDAPAAWTAEGAK